MVWFEVTENSPEIFGKILIYDINIRLLHESIRFNSVPGSIQYPVEYWQPVHIFLQTLYSAVVYVLQLLEIWKIQTFKHYISFRTFFHHKHPLIVTSQWWNVVHIRIILFVHKSSYLCSYGLWFAQFHSVSDTELRWIACFSCLLCQIWIWWSRVFFVVFGTNWSKLLPRDWQGEVIRLHSQHEMEDRLVMKKRPCRRIDDVWLCSTTLWYFCFFLYKVKKQICFKLHHESNRRMCISAHHPVVLPDFCWKEKKCKINMVLLLFKLVNMGYYLYLSSSYILKNNQMHASSWK